MYVLYGIWIVSDVKEDVRIIAASTEKYSSKYSVYGTEEVYKKLNIYERRYIHYDSHEDYANATTILEQKSFFTMHAFFIAKVWISQTFMSSLGFGGRDNLRMVVELSDWKWRIVDIVDPEIP